MDGIRDMAFCGEIMLQIKIAKRANERLKLTKNNFDNVEVWSSIQSILVAIGNISKILFPSDRKYKQRGERLRQMLNVKVNSLISNRKFRNSFFEHYDNRIDEWFDSHPTGVYTDLAMNPSLLSRNLNTHRGYNSFNNTVIFRGETLDLDSIFIEIENIFEICKQYAIE